jgi:hypothetical protein
MSVKADGPSNDYIETQLNQIDNALRELTKDGGAPYSLLGTPSAFFGSDLLFKTGPEAKDAERALFKIGDLIKALIKILNELPDDQAERISAECARSARKVEASNVGKIGAVQGIIPSFTLLAVALTPGLHAELERVKTEIKRYWTGPGTNPDWHARHVALAIAEIYIRERCEIPTFGLRPDDAGPSTLYTRKVQEVFDILGIKVGFRKPSEYAKKKVKDADLIEVKAQRQRRDAFRRAMMMGSIGQHGSHEISRYLLEFLPKTEIE